MSKVKIVSIIYAIGIVIGVLVVCLLSYFSLFHIPNEKLSFVEMRALTATDNKEVEGIYSPDGQYVVFHSISCSSRDLL